MEIVHSLFGHWTNGFSLFASLIGSLCISPYFFGPAWSTDTCMQVLAPTFCVWSISWPYYLRSVWQFPQPRYKFFFMYCLYPGTEQCIVQPMSFEWGKHTCTCLLYPLLKGVLVFNSVIAWGPYDALWRPKNPLLTAMCCLIFTHTHTMHRLWRAVVLLFALVRFQMIF